MKLFLVSLFIMIIYVLIKVDLKSFQLAQHGESTTGIWNGNDIGMKCALFIIIMLYFIDNNIKSIQRVFLLDHYSAGSCISILYSFEKSFFNGGIGNQLILLFETSNKKIRNLFVIIVGIYIAYMLFHEY